MTVTPEVASPPSHAAECLAGMLRRDPAEALAEADSSLVGPATSLCDNTTPGPLEARAFFFWRSLARSLDVSRSGTHETDRVRRRSVWPVPSRSWSC
jgi:hypothetical protein